MSVDTKASDFFVAGGTLRLDTPSYVRRPADDELFNRALAGEFCYVLTSRQMGKSSLMIRTARRLREQGVRTAIIDLTRIGTDVSVEQWYLSLLSQLKRRLRLSVDPVAWWEQRAALGPVGCFTDFLRDVILTQVEGRVVIFIDEIDTTLNLDFRDDFFAAIRAMYNARADDPEFERLTFVLLGVASPPDLIKDRARTPFNIGHGIALQEFSQADAAVLRDGLEAVYPGQGKAIFARIYHWTDGHPYLTQKLCLTVAETGDGRWTNERVDELVERLFLSEEARKEANLKFVQDKILTHPQHRELLNLYKNVVRGKRVSDDGQSPTQNQLKLSGLVKAENGVLHIRNEIYRRVFDLTWVRRNTPTNWALIVTGISIFLALLAVGFTIYIAAPRPCPPDQWCPQNDQNLQGKVVFALAGCDDGTLFAGAEDGIYRRDQGDTEWEREAETDSEVRGLAASPDCKLIYAAALNDGVLRRDGSPWSKVSVPDIARARTAALSGNTILAGGEFGVRYSAADQIHIWVQPSIFVSKTIISLVQSDGRVYVAAWGGGVGYCNKDNLDQWWPINDGLDTESALKALVALGSPTNGAPKFVGVDNGFYQWNGARWKKGPEQWGDTSTFSFAIDGATIYAGQEKNGVLRSTDNGLTWEQMNPGWETPPFQVRTFLINVDKDDQRWLYAGTSDGVWRYLLPRLSATPTPTLTATPTPTLPRVTVVPPTTPLPTSTLTIETVTAAAGSTATAEAMVTADAATAAVAFQATSTAQVAATMTAEAATDTPTPTPCIPQAEFVRHLTIPDGTTLSPGARFTKSWLLRNASLCPWPEGSKLVFVSGAQMGGPDEQEIDILPAFNETITVSVSLVAPTSTGNYEGIWQIQDNKGDPIGETFRVFIRVGPSPTPTAPPVYPPPVLYPVSIIGSNVIFRWSWSGTLAEDEYFAVRVGRDGEPHSETWIKEKTYTYPLSGSGEYSWEIDICRGDPAKGNCEQLAVSERGVFKFGGGLPTPEPP